MSKNRLDFTANLGRHSHDVTAGFTSSITTGAIVPQYFDILSPGDKIFYKTHMFCRFQKVTTAFLGEIDVHLDYFFVPMQMLYTAFGNLFAGTNDFISDFYRSYSESDNLDALPVVNFMDFFGRMPYPLANSMNPYNSESFLKGSFRLLDSLNVNPLVCQYKDYEAQTPHVNLPHDTFIGFPAPFLAYQAIYQKFFRNEEFENFDISSFNCDSLSLTSSKTFTDEQIRQLLTLRYSGRPSDYFTTVRFSPIATSLGALGASIDGLSPSITGGATLNFGDLITKVSDFLNVSVDYTGSAVNGNNRLPPSYTKDLGSVQFTNLNAQSSPLVYTTAQNIRALFALDKYMRVYGRAGKTYDDQILAHFGVKVPHDVKHDLTHLKHYRMVLQSDPVLSTADTETGAVGSVGGQVAGQLDTDEQSFTAPVHGVFMCVARVIPHPRYFCTNDRLHNISNRLSFPIPEFDKLGAQPIYPCEFGVDMPNTSGYWKNRYSEFKEKYNRVSITYSHHLNSTQGANFFSPWVISQYPYGYVSQSGLSLSDFSFKGLFVQPNALDNVMEQKYSLVYPSDETMRTSPHIVLQTDPILTEFCCFAKKVSWMSPTGEPDL